MKILIIGAGSIGLRHLKNLLKLGHRDLAVADTSRPALLKVVPISQGFLLFTDPERALENFKPQAVFICTPPASHLKLINLSLDQGVDVFVEKPLAPKLQNISAVIRKAGEQRRIAMVACNYRFHKGFLKLKSLIDNYSYGEPVLSQIRLGYYLPQARPQASYKKVYAAHKKGGGVILDSGSHVVDYIRSLFGEVRRTLIVPSIKHPLGLKSEEVACLIFEHKSGVLTSATLDFLSPKSVHRVEVVVEKGILVLDLRADNLYFENQRGRKKLYQGRDGLNQMFIDEVRHFLHCVATRQRPLQDLKDGQKVVAALAAKHYF